MRTCWNHQEQRRENSTNDSAHLSLLSKARRILLFKLYRLRKSLGLDSGPMTATDALDAANDAEPGERLRYSSYLDERDRVATLMHVSA